MGVKRMGVRKGDLFSNTAPVGESQSILRFSGMENVEFLRVMQRNLVIESDVEGKYAVSVGIREEDEDEDDEPIIQPFHLNETEAGITCFLCSDNAIHGNGLSGKVSVSETLLLFDTVLEAVNSVIWYWGDYSSALYFSVSRMETVERGNSAREILRLKAAPEKMAFGPVMFVDDTLDNETREWCLPNTRWKVSCPAT